MKNPFLSRLNTLDFCYPKIINAPGPIKKAISKTVPMFLGHVAKRNHMMDRLTVIVTDQCNLKCEHCFISTIERDKKAWEMGVEEYSKFFASAHGVIAQIHFTGGEPTVRSDFPEIMIAAAKLGNVSNSSIFTNGVNKRIILSQVEKILSGCSMRIGFQVSIDGENETHDEIRKLKGALDKTLVTIEELKKIKIANPKRIDRINVNTAISKSNLHNLKDIVELVKETGCSHTFCFARDSNIHVFNLPKGESLTEYNPVDFSAYLSAEEMEGALEILHEHLWDLDPSDLSHATNRVTLETTSKNFKRKYSKVKCCSGYSNLILTPNGGVAECEFIKIFTNMRDYKWNFKEMLESELYVNHMNRNRRCWCTHECSVGLSIPYHPHLVEDLLYGAGGGREVAEPSEIV